jgi:hypothetical protein
MKLENVGSEGDLRNWLTDNLAHCEQRLKLEWVEPSIYGSSVGAPDCKIKSGNKSVGLELKYLLSTRKGIKWTIRPAQRRYHHMNLRNGGCSAILAFSAAEEKLYLVRGDHVPLRDYASDVASGCPKGVVQMEVLDYMSVDRDRQAMFELEQQLFHDEFWE